MTEHAEDMPSVIDLMWMGRARCIASWRIGDVLVDCGPRTTLDRLLDELGDWRPRALLLTHIHFDHAGAAGALAARWPGLEVYVHRNGARHLVSPERLESSARRVFGEEFDKRFGHLDPVPEANLHVLDGGETVFGFKVEATPGHASHHVALLHDSGLAFPGDVMGTRLVDDGPVLLPTPPPDIDLDQWSESAELVARWRPAALCLPHFGRVDDPEAHFHRVQEQLARSRELIERGVDADAYIDTVRRERLQDLPAELADHYEAVVPLEQNHVGLQRWADQRAARP